MKLPFLKKVKFQKQNQSVVSFYLMHDGTILHMHHVMTMEGCEPRDMEEIERDAVRFAKKLGHSVENLKTLRAPNTINPFAKYRIDVSKMEFIGGPQNPERGCEMVNSVFPCSHSICNATFPL